MSFINREKINLSRLTYQYNNLNLEGLIFEPDIKSSPDTAVIYIHGHDSSAWRSSSIGYRLVQEGYIAFLPSVKGYGFSEGKPDYNGPETIKGLQAGLDAFLKEFPAVEKIGLWGISRGAQAAALLAVTKSERFQAVILQSGIYDAKDMYEHTTIDGIRKNFDNETKGESNPFLPRSPINMANKLPASILILHGEVDERIPVSQAQLLDKKLASSGHKHKTIIIPNAGHFIIKHTLESEVIPFLKENL